MARSVSFSKTIGVKNILLIGGEPTYYPYLFELIKYIKQQNIRSSLITNGYKFKDMRFVKEIEESGLSSISFSLKAANANQQKELTKVDVYKDIKQAIKNLSTIKNVRIGYSTVISKDTIDNIEEFAQMLANLDKTKCLRYTVCSPTFDENGNICKGCVPMQKGIVNTFVNKFDKLCEILDNKVFLEQSLAMCVWPKDFIKKLKEKNRINFGCHLQNRNGLVFNKDGKVIPCNSLPSFTLGQYGIDFKNVTDFERFWMSKELVSLYDKIYEYPSKKCQSCSDYLECGGGCPLKWFVYNAKEVLE